MIPLTALQLKGYLDGQGHDTPRISTAILTDRLSRAIQIKIDRLEKSPPDIKHWITYWLIQINADGLGAGLIGFKGAPDLEGQTEIGYGIDPGYQNQGYVTEAVLALVDWAFKDSCCMRIVAPNTLRSNPASNRVLQKAGFSIYHQTEDAISWALERKEYMSLR